ncbi:TetR/AcrR family transcriptional regulator [Streptomyces graminilatus]|uniref:TetR/AcrR family transcriptional regulator n=1 Tax=Streptomyces graminilatus TaxID=1464070 RepID=UPI000A59E28A|nr:TetR/AcrR family transcriptional regulator [Streptomyces graminilatus]
MAGRLKAPTGRYGGRTAEERQAERRRRFLDAALGLFGDTPGYRATTVAALSEAACLSTRQFYEEFRTLEDVLAALHLQVNDWAETAAFSALSGAEGLPLADRAAAIFRGYAANVTADPRRIRLSFVEIIGVSARLEEQRLARRARWVNLICQEAEAAVARGEAAPRDYRLAATAFIGSVNGLLHDWSSGWVDATLDEVVDELVRMLLGILRPADWPAPAPGHRPSGAGPVGAGRAVPRAPER